MTPREWANVSVHRRPPGTSKKAKRTRGSATLLTIVSCRKLEITGCDVTGRLGAIICKDWLPPATKRSTCTVRYRAIALPDPKTTHLCAASPRLI